MLLKAILLQVMAGLKQESPSNKHCLLSHLDQNKYRPAVSAHLKIQQL